MAWKLRWWRTYDEKAEAVLAYLREHGESAGLTICRGAGLSRGTCYVLYLRMEEEGLITSRYESSPPHPAIGLRRLLFRIDEAGCRRRSKEKEGRASTGCLPAFAFP